MTGSSSQAQEACRQAMRDAYQAWRSHHHQLELVGLDETHAPNPPLPPGGRVRLVEPGGSNRSGAGPTPAKSSETHRASSHGSSFRQSPQAPVDARVPGPRHLTLAPDPRVPTPLPLPVWMEALTWKP